MTATILIVDDEEHFRKNAGDYLTSKGYEVIGAETLGEAKDHLTKGSADIVLLDVQLPDGYGPSSSKKLNIWLIAHRSSW